MKNATKTSTARTAGKTIHPLAPALQAEAELVALAQVAPTGSFRGHIPGSVLGLLSDATLLWASQGAGQPETPATTTHGLDAFCTLGEVVAAREIGLGSLALLEQFRRCLLSSNPHVAAEEFTLDDALSVLLNEFALPAADPDYAEGAAAERALLVAVEPLKEGLRAKMALGEEAALDDF